MTTRVSADPAANSALRSLVREILVAPHLAGAAPPYIVEHRIDAVAVPVARDELDPLARSPVHTGGRLRGEPSAIDDELAAVRRLDDLDDEGVTDAIDLAIVKGTEDTAFTDAAAAALAEADDRS